MSDSKHMISYIEKLKEMIKSKKTEWDAEQMKPDNSIETLRKYSEYTGLRMAHELAVSFI